MEFGKKGILVLLAAIGSNFCEAQKEANVWYFGKRIGLDFTTNPPVLLLDGQIDYDDTPDNLEAAASIANSDGELLFYTNGVNVWNRQHAIMPNGTGLYGRNTTTQTLIVPVPESDSIYYIFTASPASDDSYPVEKIGFRYSIVDLTEDDGLGDLTDKNNLLVSSTTEKMAATKHANGKDIWVVMHEWNNNTFRAYLLTTNGIEQNPVISRAGSTHSGGLNGDMGNAIGQMKISPNGELLALVQYISLRVEVFHFDPSTGKVKIIESFSLAEIESGRADGVEFSPSNRYLYISDNSCFIFQYDLESSNIPKSVVKIVNEVEPFCPNISQLQLAPDGKIYVAQFGWSMIGVINKPNEAGALCDYDSHAIEIPPDGIHSCNLGLPNFISSYFYNAELYPPSPFFEMPNVFTPNKDGFNENFVPKKKYNIESFFLQVYNRWGQLIFQTTNMANGWDGGEYSTGVYYWQASFLGINEKHYTQKGFVHLLK